MLTTAGIGPWSVAFAEGVGAAAADVARAADARRADGQDMAKTVPRPEPPSPEQREQMRRIVDHAAEIQRDKLATERAAQPGVPARDPRDRSGRHFQVFVSRSMGWPTLEGLLQRLSGQPNVTVLFRGIPEGTKIDTAIAELGRRFRELETMPPVRIHPPAFSRADIQVVPSVVVRRDGEIIARARGTSSVQGMKRRLEEGRRGKFGQLGPVFEISEPNLITVMKARARQLDTEAIRERVRKSYWDDARFHRLRVAQEARRRTIDPTITVKRDITTPSGTVIAHKGETMNPLEMRPFSKRVVVFDATDPRQRRAAMDLAQGADQVIYLVTAFDRERGWDHYREVADKLDHPVYRLTKGLKKRWQLTHVPAVVTAEGARFVVREVPADRYSESEGGS